MPFRRLPKEQSYAAIQKPQTDVAPRWVAWGIFSDELMEINRIEILHLCHWWSVIGRHPWVEVGGGGVVPSGSWQRRRKFWETAGQKLLPDNEIEQKLCGA